MLAHNLLNLLSLSFLAYAAGGMSNTVLFPILTLKRTRMHAAVSACDTSPLIISPPDMTRHDVVMAPPQTEDFSPGVHHIR